MTKRSLPIPGHLGRRHDGRANSPMEQQQARQSMHMGQTGSHKICQLFNRADCKAIWCRRRHICNRCGLPQPEIVCPAHSREGYWSRLPQKKGIKVYIARHQRMHLYIHTNKNSWSTLGFDLPLYCTYRYRYRYIVVRWHGTLRHKA